MQYRIETWTESGEAVAHEEFTDTIVSGDDPWDALYKLVMALGIETQDVDESWKGVDNA